MSLEGRIALVTGGGRGIGKAISIALAENGATVAVNFRRDSDAAEETVKMIEAVGGKARPYAASVDDYEEVQQIFCTYFHLRIALLSNVCYTL